MTLTNRLPTNGRRSQARSTIDDSRQLEMRSLCCEKVYTKHCSNNTKKFKFLDYANEYKGRVYLNISKKKSKLLLSDGFTRSRSCMDWLKVFQYQRDYWIFATDL